MPAHDVTSNLAKSGSHDMSGRRGDTDSPGSEGGKDFTLDVAKAIANYAR